MHHGPWRGLKILTLLLLLMWVLASTAWAQVATYPRMRLSDGAQDRLVGVTPNNGLQAEQIDLTTTGTITALNGSVQLAIQGAAGAGYVLTGTWTATVQAQISLDGGTTWVAVDSYNFANELVALNVSANSSYAAADMRGASHVRVTATAFTSGTITVTLRASQAAQLQNTKFDGVPTSAVPNHAAMVGGSDGTNLQTFRTATALPAAASVGLVTREAAQGQATMANSRPVVLPSDQSAIPTSQSGTWTVQPGNTQNTTPWLVRLNDGANSNTIVAGNTGVSESTAVNVRAASLAFGLDASQVAGSQIVPIKADNNALRVELYDGVSLVNTALPNADGITVGAYRALTTLDFGMGFNGTTWDRSRTASLANMPVASTLTARNAIGATLAEKGSRWSVISNPAAGSQATASIAAEASVRHVADCVSFSAVATTAPALTALTVNLRDGASGAGTVIWTYQVVITAGTGQQAGPHSVCGLNLVGTTNTAMTLEFSAALVNLIEAVSISGYNVN